MTGGAHCAQLVPSNGATATDLDGVTSGLHVNTGTNLFIDTDTGTIWSSVGTSTQFTKVRDQGEGVVGGIGYRVTGAGVAIVAVDSFNVDPDSYVRPYGGHPILILSRGAVAIGGLVDVSGGCNTTSGFSRTCAGPGGGTGGDAETAGQGCAGGGGGVFSSPSSGGGGGGFGTAGGAGGDGDGTNLGGGGGAIAGCADSTLVPLMGGGGGGGGGTGVGGGGGGALQITSFASITVSTDMTATRAATVDAGGRGGDGSNYFGGGGGGAGGGILLEAPAITITGAHVTANGGGGGGGRNGTTSGIGTKGSTDSATPAAGGQGDASGGDGGDGGAGSTQPATGDGPIDGAGGGGGAVGRIRFNVSAAALAVSGAVVSPDASRGDLPVQ